MKVVAIINPISGAGADTRAAAARIAILGAGLERRGLTAVIRVTEYAGHAGELAKAAADAHADLVIVWGGDGTINEAGAALVGTATALGLVPSGSGNGLAASLGTPFEPRAAIAAALDGTDRTIDAGYFGGRAFFNIAGIGLDARIAARFNRRARGRRGRWPYFTIGVTEGCRYRAQEYDVDLDGAMHHLRGLLIAFANGQEYGNGARLSTSAELDDGLLDALLVEDRAVPRRFLDARWLVSGATHRAPAVVSTRIRRAVVHTNAPIEYHVDGEPGTLPAGSVEVTLVPRALRIRGNHRSSISTRIPTRQSTIQGPGSLIPAPDNGHQ